MEIIKKEIKQVCCVCNGKGCKKCNYSGQWEESINCIIIEHNGQKYCIDSDNIG